jgi:AmiR/NasT family two-component response regulator
MTSTMHGLEEPADLALQFAALNEYLHHGGDSTGALQRLVDLAIDVIPGCDWCGVTAYPDRGKPRSLAASDPIAAEVDHLQHALRQGPCVSAAVQPEVLLVDLTADDRWPAFTAAAVADTPVRGILSVHLVNQPVRSALNIYSHSASALDRDSVTAAALFAAHARVLLMHAASSDHAANLERALATSRQIGAAVGILMGAHHITEAQAFDLLRESSQRLNRKLQDVASDVRLTGELPGARLIG